MKVLVVSNMYPSNEYPSYGVFVKNFCNQLEDLSIDFDKVVMKKTNKKLKKIFRYILFYLESFLKCLFRKYEVVYVHYASHSSCGVLLANKLKQLNIYTNVHGSDVFSENKGQERMQKFTKSMLNISSKIIVPSEYFKDVVSGKYLISKNKIFIYPSGGINNKVFYIKNQIEVEQAKKNYGIENGLYTFGFAGRITKNKGWDTYLEAIRIFLDTGNNANFIIIGDGNEASELKERITELKLDKKIIFRQELISQNSLSMFYSMIDWFIFPTKRLGESLGLVAIEAMACGTPVISSDFAAPKFYIKNYYNGFKFKKGDANELASCFIKIVQKSISKNSFQVGLSETVKQFDSCNTKHILENIFRSEWVE